MKKLLLILIFPFLSISQDEYIKNNHVNIDTRIENNNYVIDYLFKDHQSNEHQIEIILEKRKTDLMIKQFGIPNSLIKSNEDFDSVTLMRRNQIIENGMFIADDGFPKEKNKKELVYYYKETISQIADYIIHYLQSINSDTRENRIEMAMKFTQDIPYGIPEENKKIYKNGYITPPEVLIEGYGDCDSKTILFVCIMSCLIPENDIVFVSIPGHIFSAIKDYDSSNNIRYNKYIPQTQQENMLREGKYVELNKEIYFICETAGPGRPNYGQSDKEIKLSYIEKIDLSEIAYLPGECYHANKMNYIDGKQRFAFEYHSCYKFNPPTSYEITAPEN